MKCPTSRKTFNLILQFFLFLLLFLSIAAQARGEEDAYSRWSWRSPLPQGNELNSFAYGNGSYVGVGYSGATIKSEDGIRWAYHHSGTNDVLADVAFGNGTFVAVGRTTIDPQWGQGVILASNDGTSWTNANFSSEIFTDSPLTSVVYGNGTFVAVGKYGMIFTSPDGLVWTDQTFPNWQASGMTSINEVIFENGLFVAVGERVLTSEDGFTWTDRTPAGMFLLNGVAYGNGAYIAVGFVAGGMGQVSSSDGITWTPTSYADGPLRTIAFGNGTFTGDSFTSTDGSTWTRTYSFDPCFFTPSEFISFVNGIFITSGGHGTIITSIDGALWEVYESERVGYFRGCGDFTMLNSVIFANNTLVAVGTSIGTSLDGSTWNNVPVDGTSRQLLGVAHGNGIFVVVGEAGLMALSETGAEWTVVDAGVGPADGLSAIAFGNGKFVALSGLNALTSTDGINWMMYPASPAAVLNAITYGNGVYVAVGDDGAILTSEDGAAWNVRESGITSSLRGVTYGNGMFVAIGDFGAILTSDNGTTWTPQNGGIATKLRGVTFGNGMFAAVGDYGAILTSTDGVVWTSRMRIWMDFLSSIVAVDGTFLAVGPLGTIIQTVPLQPRIRVNPQFHMFRYAYPGPSYPPQKITISNTGGTDLTITGMTLSGDTAHFSLASGDCGSLTPTLPAGTSCFVEVSFDGDPGFRYATLTIASDDPVNPSVTVSFSANDDPPYGSINFSDYVTAGLDVTLTIDAFDTYNGVAGMRFRNGYCYEGTNLGWSAWEPYTTSKNWRLSYGPSGMRTVCVQFKDGAGNTNWNSADIYYNPPSVTNFQASPPSFSKSASGSFRFGTGKIGDTFQCKLDNGPWEACTSPRDFTSLGDGPHTFSVFATDVYAVIESPAKSYTWTIDTVLPVAAITTQPAGLTGTIGFSGSETNLVFQCRFDGGIWSDCTSPYSFSSLGDGDHSLEVKAVDRAGNASAAPATVTWNVDSQAVSIGGTFYPTLSGALAAVLDGGTITLKNRAYAEVITFSEAKRVIMIGGYGPNFEPPETGAVTTIAGLTITNGTVEVQGVVIRP